MMCYSCKKYDECERPWKCDETMYDCTAYELEQTNEEYLRSLNTEQLAKVLLSFCQYPCEICKIECDDGNACTYNKALNTIVEWLKQPHTNE